jgi:hypothetical protein
LTVAEERITTKFSRLLGARAREEEATFLAPQQVDETLEREGPLPGVTPSTELCEDRRDVGAITQPGRCQPTRW